MNQNPDPEYFKRMMMAQILSQGAQQPAAGNPLAAGLGQLASAYAGHQMQQRQGIADKWAQKGNIPITDCFGIGS